MMIKWMAHTTQGGGGGEMLEMMQLGMMGMECSCCLLANGGDGK